MDRLTLLSRRPKENNREYVYRLLRYNIMTLVLVPGCSINEAEVAEQLGVSRTPVHEALTMLKNEYLVEILPQSGSFVTKISLRNIREGLFMRATMEPAIYRQLAGNIGEEYLDQMAANLEEASHIMLNDQDDSLDRYLKLDDNFHKIAYLAAQKPILWSAVKTVCSHFQRIRYQESILIKIDMSHIHHEHEQLYEYLMLGGSCYFDLEKHYDMHLSYFKTYFAQLLEMHPEYYIKN